MIDEQHKKYFSIVNRIFDQLDSSSSDRQVLGDIVKELVDYAFYHFGTEEKYFNEFDYPGIKFHMKQHEIYRAKMKEFLAKMQDVKDEGISILFGEIATFATEWFADHILVQDKKFTKCFNEHGLE